MPSAIAQEKLAARAHRIRLLRRRIVATVLATFVLAWSVVAFEGSMGTTTTVASTTSSTPATTSSETPSSPAETDATAPMTTSQS